jgi:hypothetical protein
MPEYSSGSLPADQADNAPTGLQRRLARALADMIDGAASVRVSQRDPQQSWPTPFLRAYDEHGRPVPVTRVQRLTAARWIIRAHPGIDWSEPYDFDLATATLSPAAKAAGAANEGN